MHNQFICCWYVCKVVYSKVFIMNGRLSLYIQMEENVRILIFEIYPWSYVIMLYFITFIFDK